MINCLAKFLLKVHIGFHVRVHVKAIALRDLLSPAARHAPLFFTVSPSLLGFMFIELVMLSNHLILCCPFSFCLQSSQDQGLLQ